MGEWILIEGIGGFLNGIFGIWEFLESIWSLVRGVGKGEIFGVLGFLFGIQKILE